MARCASVQDHHGLLALVRDGVGDRADEELLERAALVLHQHLRASGGPVSALCCALSTCIGSGPNLTSSTVADCAVSKHARCQSGPAPRRAR